MKRQILNAKELCDRWNVDYKDILYLIKKQEILWYNDETLEYESPEEEARWTKHYYDEYEGGTVKKSLDELRDIARNSFTLDYLINKQRLIYFKVAQIEAYEKKHPELVHTRPD